MITRTDLTVAIIESALTHYSEVAYWQRRAAGTDNPNVLVIKPDPTPVITDANFFAPIKQQGPPPNRQFYKGLKRYQGHGRHS